MPDGHTHGAGFHPSVTNSLVAISLHGRAMFVESQFPKAAAALLEPAGWASERCHHAHWTHTHMQLNLFFGMWESWSPTRMLPCAQRTHCPTQLQLQLFFLAKGGTSQKHCHAHCGHTPKTSLMFFLGSYDSTRLLLGALQTHCLT